MICRNCGTEIADKAIVCYRCGTATTDPVRKPVVVRSRRSPLLSFVVLVLLALLAIYLGTAGRTMLPGREYGTVAGVLVGAAIAVLLFRITRRR